MYFMAGRSSKSSSSVSKISSALGGSSLASAKRIVPKRTRRAAKVKYFIIVLLVRTS